MVFLLSILLITSYVNPIKKGWRKLNDLNALACYELGIAWMLTGEQAYFTRVRDILMASARYYPGMPNTGGSPITAPEK